MQAKHFRMDEKKMKMNGNERKHITAKVCMNINHNSIFGFERRRARVIKMSKTGKKMMKKNKAHRKKKKRKINAKQRKRGKKNARDQNNLLLREFRVAISFRTNEFSSK